MFGGLEAVKLSLLNISIPYNNIATKTTHPKKIYSLNVGFTYEKPTVFPFVDPLRGRKNWKGLLPGTPSTDPGLGLYGSRRERQPKGQTKQQSLNKVSSRARYSGDIPRVATQ